MPTSYVTYAYRTLADHLTETYPHSSDTSLHHSAILASFHALDHEIRRHGKRTWMPIDSDGLWIGED